MYTVSKEIEFDAGHRVPNHASKCRNPHGHRYRVRVTVIGQLVETPGASDEGMLVDFGDLKTHMMEQIHDKYDHGFVVYKHDKGMIGGLNYFNEYEDWVHKVIVTDWIPTAENFAREIWYDMLPHVQAMNYSLSLVEVWETPTSLATYSGV